MKTILLSFILLTLPLIAKSTADIKKEKEAVKKAMEQEKKFAKEQKFYQGSEYDLKSKEVNPDSLKDLKVPEPQNDFDMDDVYD